MLVNIQWQWVYQLLKYDRIWTENKIELNWIELPFIEVRKPGAFSDSADIIFTRGLTDLIAVAKEKSRDFRVFMNYSKKKCFVHSPTPASKPPPPEMQRNNWKKKSKKKQIFTCWNHNRIDIRNLIKNFKTETSLTSENVWMIKTEIEWFVFVWFCLSRLKLPINVS